MRCPYCAEEIKPEAIVCRFCQRDLLFYKPIATRLDALEDKIANLESLFASLAESISPQHFDSQARTVSRSSSSFYIAALLIGTVCSVGSYNIYLQISSTGRLFLWLSLLAPFLVGIWIGLQSPDRDFKSIILVGVGAGFLGSAGVAISLSFYLREVGGRIDWEKMFLLYFLTPLFLITLGGFIGEWLQSRRSGRGEPPSYARNIAELLARSNKEQGEERERQIELITRLITGLAPLLVFIASLISTWLAYLQATNQ